MIWYITITGTKERIKALNLLLDEWGIATRKATDSELQFTYYEWNIGYVCEAFRVLGFDPVAHTQEEEDMQERDE